MFLGGQQLVQLRVKSLQVLKISSSCAQRRKQLQVFTLMAVHADQKKIILRGGGADTGTIAIFSFSTPELFSFTHDRRREELWGTLDQALSLFVVG